MPHPGSCRRKSLSWTPGVLTSEFRAWLLGRSPPSLAVSAPGDPPACGPSALLQHRLVQHERLQCLLRWPPRAPRQALFSSGAQPSSHRPFCEAVGSRPLSPAVFGYPSDIQLFLREEAHFWQLPNLDSRKLCLTPFLFVSNQWVRLYHVPPGCVSPSAALTLPLLLSSPYYSELTASQVERHETYKGKGQDRGHVRKSLLLPT